MRQVFIIGGVILAVYLLGRRRLAANVKVLLRGVSFAGGLKKPTLSLRFGIQNPTDREAHLLSLVGKVDANGRTVADVSAFETVRILPNQETRYQVSVTPAAVGIIQTLAQFIRAKERQPVRVAFTGTANVDGLNIPIQQTATL
jgi:hypothetical protein